jgi:ABC-type uncharacterized transport system permease subunit
LVVVGLALVLVLVAQTLVLVTQMVTQERTLLKMQERTLLKMQELTVLKMAQLVQMVWVLCVCVCVWVSAWVFWGLDWAWQLQESLRGTSHEATRTIWCLPLCQERLVRPGCCTS